MSTFISDIRARIIDPSFAKDRFKQIAQESGYDITQKFRPFEREELINDVTKKLLGEIQEYLESAPTNFHEKTLQPCEQQEIHQIIKAKIMEICEINENSYGGYSTTSTFWPWVTSSVGSYLQSIWSGSSSNKTRN